MGSQLDCVNMPPIVSFSPTRRSSRPAASAHMSPASLLAVNHQSAPIAIDLGLADASAEPSR